MNETGGSISHHHNTHAFNNAAPAAKLQVGQTLQRRRPRVEGRVKQKTTTYRLTSLR
jgi:hypothetical protein